MKNKINCGKEYMEEELLQKLSQLYDETEKNTPPRGFVTPRERSYNNGFYQGQLKALEIVCRELFGITGDDLPPSPIKN